MKLVLEGERPMSWNKFYAGKFWDVRKREADRVHLAVRSEIDPDEAQIFTRRVNITITTYFDKRPYDACNVPIKMYIDGLIGWYIKDDDIKYVRATTSVIEIDRQRPRVEIEMIETNEPCWDKLPK